MISHVRDFSDFTAVTAVHAVPVPVQKLSNWNELERLESIREGDMKDEVSAAQAALQRIRDALQSKRRQLEAANDAKAVAIISASVERLEREKLHATKELLQAQEAAALRQVIRAREEWAEHLEELRATRERLKLFAFVG
jgi:HAMP domain-containing protein